MATKSKASARKQAAKKSGKSGEGFELAALLEYLANGAVSELVVVEGIKGTYGVAALLTWKPRRCVLIAARGGQRTFRSVDTVVRLFKQVGVGKTLIRMELKT